MQDPLDNLIPYDEDSIVPVTPQPTNATIEGLSSDHNEHSENATSHLTPPPSTQVQASRKDRTPTPTYSSISTPPPTVDASTQQGNKLGAGAATMTSEQLANAAPEELRACVIELQAAYQEVRMNAAHHKLQYQMLVQESAAALERMGVEARMAQHENDIIHIAEQAKAAMTPSQALLSQEGMIHVQKDLYQSMCLEIQHLTKLTSSLHSEMRRQERIILTQENEIESLSDRVVLMRDRIRTNREHINHYRRPSQPPAQTPRSVYATPRRNHGGQDQFAALLQASEMASQEATSSRSGKKSRSAAGVTMTPQRYHKSAQPAHYATPSRQPLYSMPATAPVPRTATTFEAPTMYAQSPSAKVTTARLAKIPPAPRSEETVSNSDRDIDSEAETEIIEPDGDIAESQASRAASLMLRNSQEDGLNTKDVRPQGPQKLKQTRLFGAVRKSTADVYDDGRPAKKARTGGIGLGIVNARS